MKSKKITENTTDSRVYKLAINEMVLSCNFCGPNKGCNSNRNNDNNWKTHRGTQWREIKND